MTRLALLSPAVGLLGLAVLGGCGTNMEQRAATGAATGLVVAGPVGAVVGGAAGAVVNEVDEAEKNN
jgi:osmotically inducible lipoprotein OsmB